MNREGWTTTAAILIAQLGLGGCAERSTQGTQVVVSDSAGIHVIDHLGVPESTASIRLANEPVYRHGDDPNEYLFSVIWLGRLQPDGSAVILDATSSELLRISPVGNAYTILARAGQGPQEIRRVSSLHVLGQDSLLIEDDGNARFAVFADGNLASTVSTGGDRSIGLDLVTLGVSPEGDLLMGTSAYRSDFEEPWLAGRLVRFDLSTITADTVGSYDMAPRTSREGPNNAFAPYGWAVAADGHFVVFRTDIPEIRWIDAEGNPVRILRWQPLLSYPTEADLEALRAQLRLELRRINPQMSGAEAEPFIQQQLERYELRPETPLPLFGTMQGDASGRLWLSAFTPGGPRTGVESYTLIGATGEWLGTVATPPSFRLLDAGYGRVLGVMRDDLDVEHVVVFLLETE